jgi:hypothetical protein
MNKYLGFLLLFFVVLVSCTSTKQLTTNYTPTNKELQYLHTYTIPHNYTFKESIVGGLSAIDYDEKNNQYYMVCDDRSSLNPARFYKAKIVISQNKIDTVIFTQLSYLKDENGKTYPSTKENPYKTPDPESIRYNPNSKLLVWSSEGENTIRGKDSILINPSVYFVTPNGKFKDSVSMPGNLYMSFMEKGPRQNGVLEGMSYADNYKTLMVNVEEPLQEDGPRADLKPNGAMIRFYQFDMQTKKSTRQYAYELSPVVYAPNPINEYKINSVPEFLWIGNNQLLVLERSYSTGRIPCSIRIFLADYNQATDVSAFTSLKAPAQYQPMKKTLLMNLDELGIYTDNIEGISFGPILPNGNRSILLVSDNNFSPIQKSQITLLELKTPKS